MTVDTHWKPGARDAHEHGKWVTRPHGLRTRETRTRDKRAWRKDHQ